MKNTVTAASNILRKAKLQAVLWLVIAVISGGLMGLFSALSSQKADQAQTLVQEKLNSSLTEEGVQQVRILLEENQNGAQALQTAFPNVTTFPNVVAELEELMAVHDPASLVQLAQNTKPVKVGGELSILMTLNLKAQVSAVETFLRELEGLPYLIEIVGLEMRMPEGQGGIANTTIGIRLYVQDPFTKT